MQQLAPAEQHVAAVCQQTLELVNETEFSVTLGPALESLEKDMLVVSGELTGGRGDQPVIESQVAIEQDLKDLLETFKEMPTTDGQCDSQCNGCKGNMNKLLAELKVVRMMQMRVNKGTVDADGGSPRRGHRRITERAARENRQAARRPGNHPRRGEPAARAVCSVKGSKVDQS